MPDTSPSFGDAQLRVVQVIRDHHPEWVDDAGECPACVPYELELAMSAPSAVHAALTD